MSVMMDLYDRIVDKDLLIRRVNVVAAGLISETEIPEEAPEQISFFIEPDVQEQQRIAEAAADDKEKRLQKTMLQLQGRFGKNAVLKGMNFSEGATTRERNGQIGGHRADATD